MLTEREELRLKQAPIAYYKTDSDFLRHSPIGPIFQKGTVGTYLRSMRSTDDQPWGWFGVWYEKRFIYINVSEREIEHEIGL